MPNSKLKKYFHSALWESNFMKNIQIQLPSEVNLRSTTRLGSMNNDVNLSTHPSKLRADTKLEIQNE